jgi:hypothetical protein
VRGEPRTNRQLSVERQLLEVTRRVNRTAAGAQKGMEQRKRGGWCCHPAHWPTTRESRRAPIWKLGQCVSQCKAASRLLACPEAGGSKKTRTAAAFQHRYLIRCKLNWLEGARGAS